LPRSKAARENSGSPGIVRPATSPAPGGTYKQWAEAGAQVRKGEKSAYIVFYKEITVGSDDSDEAETRLFARATPVFAAEQVDGLAAPVIMRLCGAFRRG
jgi:hypothetical protein